MDAADTTSELVGRDVLDVAGQRLGRVDSLYRDLDAPDLVFAEVAMIRRGPERRDIVVVINWFDSLRNARR